MDDNVIKVKAEVQRKHISKIRKIHNFKTQIRYIFGIIYSQENNIFRCVPSLHIFILFLGAGFQRKVFG